MNSKLQGFIKFVKPDDINGVAALVAIFIAILSAYNYFFNDKTEFEKELNYLSKKPDLIIPEGETLIVSSTDGVFNYKKLVLNKKAILQFPDSMNLVLNVQDLVIHEEAWINTSGANGANGMPVNNGANASRDCQNGGNGQPGQRGQPGKPASSLSINVLNLSLLSSKFVVKLKGGFGGNGTNGGNGGRGGKADRSRGCRGGKGGNGGNGGDAGQAGKSGRFIMTYENIYTSLTQNENNMISNLEFKNKVSIINNPSESGRVGNGGSGGRGGAGKGNSLPIGSNSQPRGSNGGNGVNGIIPVSSNVRATVDIQKHGK